MSLRRLLSSGLALLYVGFTMARPQPNQKTISFHPLIEFDFEKKQSALK